MCGLAGWVYLDGRPMNRERDNPVLEAMGAAIHHRGPDDTQTMLWQNVGFVFKRLSIVDLDGGRQPFETPDGRVCAMVNGEIYNHRDLRRHLKAHHHFQSDSDCEVIPYQYLDRGLDLLDDVNGMFAMAILDRHQGRLLLARDRLGIKPLYYCLADEGRLLVFASELKGLFAHPSVPRRFDWRSALGRNFGAGTKPVELGSFFLGIEKLPAGHILDLNLNDSSRQLKRYWSIPARADDQPIQSPEHYVARYRELLSDSVRLRLMADVRYGVFLSGGVDSAAIAAFASEHKSCPTFSVLSKATLASGDVEASIEVADHLRLPNHQVLFDAPDIQIGPDDWRHILWACEFHLANPEQLYKYWLHGFARQRYPDLKVILLGQGSDEFNGGYISRFVEPEAGWEPRHWQELGRGLRRQDNSIRASWEGLALDWNDLIQSGVFDLSSLQGFADEQSEPPVLDRYMGFYRQNLDYHLWHEDRTASAHSIEDRVPFLDHRLVEFLAGIPESLHAELFTDKRILRSAVGDLLPDRLADRAKGYFYIGPGEHHTNRMMLEILVQNQSELVEQAIEGSISTGGVFDPDRMRAVVQEVAEDPEHRSLPRLIQLVNMGLLADMARNVEFIKSEPPRLPVYELSDENLRRWVATEKASSAETTDELSDDMVLALGQGTNLVEVKTAGKGGVAVGAWCVVINGQISHAVTSPAWSRFLQSVDGQRTLAQVLAEECLNGARMRKLIPEALASGVLVNLPKAVTQSGNTEAPAAGTT